MKVFSDAVDVLTSSVVVLDFLLNDFNVEDGNVVVRSSEVVNEVGNDVDDDFVVAIDV